MWPGPARADYGVGVNVLLGGLVTLAVTCVVQIFVIPWVQHRGRRRERWEKNVTELLVLLEEQLPSTIRELSIAMSVFRAVRVMEAQAPRTGPGIRSSHYMQVYKEAREASKAAEEAAARAHLLLERVALVRRQSMYWTHLRDALFEVGRNVWRAGAFADPGNVTDDEGSNRISAVKDSLRKLVAEFRTVSDPMKPPPARWPPSKPPSGDGGKDRHIDRLPWPR